MSSGHLVGNLQVFEDPDKINGYAHFLQSLGPTLWAVRVVLLVCVSIHIWAATTLAIEDRRARGPEPYRVNTWLQATVLLAVHALDRLRGARLHRSTIWRSSPWGWPDRHVQGRTFRTTRW